MILQRPWSRLRRKTFFASLSFLIGQSVSAATSHWSWQPLSRPALPAAFAGSHPVDAFILHRLRPLGLTLAPGADRLTLIRRLTFNLTGLPPKPAEIDAFLADASGDAYDKLVDRLLASPQYGEHWAQYWLDLARFAETDGFEHDKVRPNAWRYRDWVIKALNTDLPYNRFVRLQVAGDQMHPDDPEAAIATGFLLAGQDMPDINLLAERRHMLLNEMTATVGSVFLGLTLGCAQCHDHKSDPVSQREFYRMRAFFESDLQLKEVKLGDINVRTMRNGKASATHVMTRGDFRRPGEKVQAGFPRIANTVKSRPVQGTRKELAAWLTHPGNAPAMRLFANRLWLRHFGRALATPGNFGTSGEPPTHPVLLDWLATELPRRKWSLRAMHKLIVTSATWRQAGRDTGNDPAWAKRLKADQNNRLWSRQDRRRLTGEMLRDSLLSCSDSLSERRGGPGVRPELPKEITVTLLRNQWQVSKDETDHRRRSVYLFARRNLRYPLFDLFDRPARAETCALRVLSTTAPQSLALLNSGFVVQRAKELARRAADENATAVESIRFCYRCVLGRLPRPEEQAGALQLVKRSGNSGQGLADLALALFNFNEFIYID
ncbi:MAG: DUF1549 and DUF1553 domain-containing protein [Verrucomicrobiales bacterium]